MNDEEYNRLRNLLLSLDDYIKDNKSDYLDLLDLCSQIHSKQIVALIHMMLDRREI